MALLNAARRKRCTAYLMRTKAWPGFVKPDLAAMVAAIDDWAEANAAGFNAALPQPIRGSATADQKESALSVVMAERAGSLVVEEDQPV